MGDGSDDDVRDDDETPTGSDDEPRDSPGEGSNESLDVEPETADADDESGSDDVRPEDDDEMWQDPAAGSDFADDLDDPAEHVDEDDEVPDWVEESKREREEREAAERDAEDVAASGPSTDEVSAHGGPGAQAAAAGGGGGGGVVGGGTAPDDEEMPLTEHVEEMALRFMAVGLVVVGVGAIALFYADELINFLWYSFLGPGLRQCLDLGTMEVQAACPQSKRPRVYHPLALVLARLKVATLVGLIVALPVGVYQTYRFMRPGLYPRERRYYLAAVPTSLVLAAVGVGFAYFAILPAMFSYFTQYSERAAEIAFGLTETFNLIVLMLGFFALTFQIPLLVMLAIMMGVTTRQWLADRRLYFWGGFAAVAFLFSPDPTGMAPLMVAVTMIALFDGTLLLLKWTSSESLVPTAEGLSARRPYAWAAAVLVGYLLSAAPVPQGYYDAFPPVVVEWLAANGLVSLTPVIVGGSLVALFELGAYLLRRYGHSERALRARLAVHRTRIPAWLLAVTVGYFGSPDPLLLRAAEQVALPTAQALAVTGGLLIAYELAIGVLRWRNGTDEAVENSAD